MRIFAWLMVIIGSVVGGFVFITGFLTANGAPQQAAAASAGVAFVVIPYCAARAISMLWDIGKEKKTDND